jgi:hypothetical protein
MFKKLKIEVFFVIGISFIRMTSTTTNTLNNKFLKYAKDLRMQALQGFDGILLFFDNKVFCYKHGDCKGFKALDLAVYDVYKTLAHTIIYYSEKHKEKYERAADLCPQIQHELSDLIGGLRSENRSFEDPLRANDFDSQIWKDGCNPYYLTIKELMHRSSELYLASLHEAVQTWKDTVFDGNWPSSLLVIVSGPSSPRFGHPAMQYFSRLTNTTLESNEELVKDDIVYDPLRLDKYIGRKLYYIENASNFVQAIEIGLSLWVEESVFSQYQSMKSKTDILSKDSHEYLNSKCHRESNT